MSYFSSIAAFSDIFDKYSNNENSIVQEEKGEHVPVSSDYTVVTPINISTPTDWDLYDFITGNGSDTDPYVIENIEIQGEGVKTIEESGHSYLNYSDIGIYINAAGNFTIRNCRISSISIGIELDVEVSTGYIHNIQGVEINNCGTGIYCYWRHYAVNISRCDISNCNWVTIKAPYDMYSSLYGGFGMWVRGDEGSIIEYCHIQNCSIGLFTAPPVSLISNHLINCGFLFDLAFILIPNVMFNNTINGKPLGLFVDKPNLTISGEEASQYGQLIFTICHNIHLSNFRIKERCSFGLLLDHCNYPILQNIVCENQQIGFLIYADYMTADNLHTKNCDAGFCLIQIRHSILTRLSMDNTDVPVYAYPPTLNASIGIEKSTRFYIIDYYGIDEIQINSSISSIMVPRSNMSEFDIEGFIIQLDEIDTYHITGFEPVHNNLMYDFIIVIFEPSKALAIPGFPLIWFYTAILLGILFSKLSLQCKKR